MRNSQQSWAFLFTWKSLSQSMCLIMITFLFHTCRSSPICATLTILASLFCSLTTVHLWHLSKPLLLNYLYYLVPSLILLPFSCPIVLSPRWNFYKKSNSLFKYFLFLLIFFYFSWWHHHHASYVDSETV